VGIVCEEGIDNFEAPLNLIFGVRRHFHALVLEETPELVEGIEERSALALGQLVAEP
jgi:hypothetical protein